MTWPAPRRSRQVPIRPCPILTTQSICRSIRPSRPSTCSIIREARPSRNASMYSSNIPVAGCASSTISLCEYLLPFESKTTLLFFFFFFLHSAISTRSSIFLTNNLQKYEFIRSSQDFNSPRLYFRYVCSLPKAKYWKTRKMPRQRPLLLPFFAQASILASWPLTPGVPRILDDVEDFSRLQSNTHSNRSVYRVQSLISDRRTDTSRRTLLLIILA